MNGYRVPALEEFWKAKFEEERVLRKAAESQAELWRVRAIRWMVKQRNTKGSRG